MQMRKSMLAVAVLGASVLAMPAMAATTTPTNTGATVAARTAAVHHGHRHGHAAWHKHAGKSAPVAYSPPAPKKVEWMYMAKRMRPPKNHKWTGRWNDLGQQGWELVSQSENLYIFKRPGDYVISSSMTSTPSSSAAPKATKTKAASTHTKAAPASSSGGKVFKTSGKSGNQYGH